MFFRTDIEDGINGLQGMNLENLMMRVSCLWRCPNLTQCSNVIVLLRVSFSLLLFHGFYVFSV